MARVLSLFAFAASVVAAGAFFSRARRTLFASLTSSSVPAFSRIFPAFFFRAFPSAYAACSDQNLLPNPADPAARGPWAVGLRTVVITSRNMTVDVLYPALPGSDAGRSFIEYDIRKQIPERQAAKIPDEVAPIQVVEAFRDLPLDTTHGPYPVHIHVCI